MSRRNETHAEKAQPGDGELDTLGAKLRAAREEQGWAVEEVSRMLRLRPVILRELENDDLRSFPHASYARMSILGYARLLGLKEEEIHPWLPPKGDLTSGEFTYLDRLQNPEPAARREDFSEQRSSKRKPVEIIVKVVVLLVLVLVGVYAIMFWNDLGRIQGGQEEAVEAAAPEPVPASTPIPVPVVEITASSAKPLPEEPFELSPLNSPTPFLEQDAMALELEIPMAEGIPWPGDGDVEEPPVTAEASDLGEEVGIVEIEGMEVRPAVPVQSSPAQDLDTRPEELPATGAE